MPYPVAAVRGKGMVRPTRQPIIFPAGSLFGGVQALTVSGDYDVESGSGGEDMPVEFVNVAGDWTISANTNLGSATADQRLLAYRIRGNLTIEAGHTVTAAARKLGLLLFVDGDVTIDGILSMSARGANHSATGSDLTAFDVRLYDLSADANNIWPAVGAVGGAAVHNLSNNGNPGAAGVNGQAGGGGSGACRADGATSGAGASGTAYGGGPGGGAARDGFTAGSGAARGGSGGNAVTLTQGAGGGGGNPGGAGAAGGGSGNNGTGGALILVAHGRIAIGATGVIRSNGAAGGGSGDDFGRGGGGSGAGPIGLYHQGAYTNAGTVQANGGAGGVANRSGGAGGAGSIRTVAL